MPDGTRFFQCLKNPCCIVPAMMLLTNVSDASAAVTLKFAVAVDPPCTRCARNESGPECMNQCLVRTMNWKIGMRTRPLQTRMYRSSEMNVGVHVDSNLFPT